MKHYDTNQACYNTIWIFSPTFYFLMQTELKSLFFYTSSIFFSSVFQNQTVCWKKPCLYRNTGIVYFHPSELGNPKSTVSQAAC